MSSEKHRTTRVSISATLHELGYRHWDETVNPASWLHIGDGELGGQLAASDTSSLSQRLVMALALRHDRSAPEYLVRLAGGNGFGQLLAALLRADLLNHGCSTLSVGDNHDRPVADVEALRLHDAGAHIVKACRKGPVGGSLFFGTVRATAQDRGQRSCGALFIRLPSHCQESLITADQAFQPRSGFCSHEQRLRWRLQCPTGLEKSPPQTRRQCRGPGGPNRMMHRDAPPRGGAPGEVITSEIVERVFGLPTVVIDDPVTGSPLCVPAIS